MDTRIEEKEILEKAKKIGFHKAAFMKAEDMVIVPQYREFCEMNLCHCYGVVPACPPKCGTVEEMTARIKQYTKVLVLQTEYDSDFKDDPDGAKEAKKEHNLLADKLVDSIWGKKGDFLRMTAGPWKNNSCMSAYCVDVQKMADTVGMLCWAQDGKCRFFSQILMK